MKIICLLCYQFDKYMLIIIHLLINIIDSDIPCTHGRKLLMRMRFSCINHIENSFYYIYVSGLLLLFLLVSLYIFFKTVHCSFHRFDLFF